MYKAEFSKSFIVDQTVVLEYIALTLSNLMAAIKLKHKINEKIDAILVFPEGFPEFDTENKTKYQYRRVKVNNYFIFYRFDKNNNIIHFSRFIYLERDLSNIEFD